MSSFVGNSLVWFEDLLSLCGHGITAPGVNILAASLPSKNQAVNALSYNVHLGTSMAFSHVAGVAAVLKAQQVLQWRVHSIPAAIMSALMTTG